MINFLIDKLRNFEKILNKRIVDYILSDYYFGVRPNIITGLQRDYILLG